MENAAFSERPEESELDDLQQPSAQNAARAPSAVRPATTAEICYLSFEIKGIHAGDDGGIYLSARDKPEMQWRALQKPLKSLAGYLGWNLTKNMLVPGGVIFAFEPRPQARLWRIDGYALEAFFRSGKKIVDGLLGAKLSEGVDASADQAVTLVPKGCEYVSEAAVLKEFQQWVVVDATHKVPLVPRPGEASYPAPTRQDLPRSAPLKETAQVTKFELMVKCGNECIDTNRRIAISADDLPKKFKVGQVLEGKMVRSGVIRFDCFMLLAGETYTHLVGGQQTSFSYGLPLDRPNAVDARDGVFAASPTA